VLVEGDLMSAPDGLRAALSAAMQGAASALGAADQLCRACLPLLGVDGAAISVFKEGVSRGTFGSSGVLSRRLDELQFTFGEGPCMDAVASGRPVLVADLADCNDLRWPAFRGAVLDCGVRAVFSWPVTFAAGQVGALDLFRTVRGDLTERSRQGGAVAARLAALPLLEMMAVEADWEGAGQGEPGWEQLASLERVEVYQATGMIMEALGVRAEEALIRLRAHAFARGLTASEVAWEVVEQGLLLETDSGPEGLREQRDVTP
jgi:hypothetical protein